LPKNQATTARENVKNWPKTSTTHTSNTNGNKNWHLQNFVAHKKYIYTLTPRKKSESCELKGQEKFL